MGELKFQVGCKGPLDHIVIDAESERYVDLKGMWGGGGVVGVHELELQVDS